MRKSRFAALVRGQRGGRAPAVRLPRRMDVNRGPNLAVWKRGVDELELRFFPLIMILCWGNSRPMHRVGQMDCSVKRHKKMERLHDHTEDDGRRDRFCGGRVDGRSRERCASRIGRI